MKLSWFFDALCTGRTAVCVSAGAILLSSTAAMAANDVVLWHSLNPYNKGVFEDLVKDFNKEQDEVKVRLKAFDNEKDRKSVVEGKSVSVRVDLGGRRIIKNKITKNVTK